MMDANGCPMEFRWPVMCLKQPRNLPERKLHICYIDDYDMLSILCLSMFTYAITHSSWNTNYQNVSNINGNCLKHWSSDKYTSTNWNKVLPKFIYIYIFIYWTICLHVYSDCQSNVRPYQPMSCRFYLRNHKYIFAFAVIVWHCDRTGCSHKYNCIKPCLSCLLQSMAGVLTKLWERAPSMVLPEYFGFRTIAVSFKYMGRTWW